MGILHGRKGSVELYRQFPELCASLTFESTGLGLRDTDERLSRLQKDQSWAIKILNEPDLFLQEWYSQDLFAPLKTHQDFEQVLASRRNTLTAQHAQMILEASPGNNSAYHDVIRNLSVPTLALVGEKDITYCGIWEKVVETNPQINVKVIANSGHVVHVENPQQAVAEFLNFHK